MPKTIKMRLCESDIQKAIKEVDMYWKTLETKTKVFCGKLADLGFEVAKANISQSPIGAHIKLNLRYKQLQTKIKAILVATGDICNTDYGQVSMLAMIEFGSGIHFNPTDNPKAREFGMGIGTFPNQTHAFDTNGWYYMDDSGEWHHSYGIKATMPMYSASHEMIKNIRSIAREVFK